MNTLKCSQKNCIHNKVFLPAFLYVTGNEISAGGHRSEIRARQGRGASSSKKMKRRKFAPISGAQLSKAKVLTMRFLAHVYATKTLGNWMLPDSPGHENPSRSSPSFSRPADLDEFRGSLILFSNVPIAVPRGTARPARGRTRSPFSHPFCSYGFFLRKVKIAKREFAS